jgi:hypothetical protein
MDGHLWVPGRHRFHDAGNVNAYVSPRGEKVGYHDDAVRSGLDAAGYCLGDRRDGEFQESGLDPFERPLRGFRQPLHKQSDLCVGGFASAAVGGYNQCLQIFRSSRDVKEGGRCPLPRFHADDCVSALIDAFVYRVVDDLVQPTVWHLAAENFVLCFDFADQFVNHFEFLRAMGR